MELLRRDVLTMKVHDAMTAVMITTGSLYTLDKKAPTKLLPFIVSWLLLRMNVLHRRLRTSLISAACSYITGEPGGRLPPHSSPMFRLKVEEINSICV